MLSLDKIIAFHDFTLFSNVKHFPLIYYKMAACNVFNSWKKFGIGNWSKIMECDNFCRAESQSDSGLRIDIFSLSVRPLARPSVYLSTFRLNITLKFWNLLCHPAISSSAVFFLFQATTIEGRFGIPMKCFYFQSVRLWITIGLRQSCQHVT